MKPILEIKDISKKFLIHHEQQPYLSLRDSITSVFQNKSKKGDEDFWALKNVSFNVAEGESIGIIGRNGAGKSTLLKILSKITPPTSGKIISRGRIASLLEVGTGFHAELSGRENIFLNGSILGMKHREIEEKFDEIVDFSGVAKFIDTPIKHYSTGMQLRLAFSVAAFLEPEIMLVDEVLAVGDAEFQKKCLGKMNEVSHSGRTVIFVSHNLDVIELICNRGVVLENGAVVKISEASEAVRYYRQLTQNLSYFEEIINTNQIKWKGILNLEKLISVNPNDNIVLDMLFEAGETNLQNIHFDIAISNEKDNIVLHARSVIFSDGFSLERNNSVVVKYQFDSPHLAPGNYYLTVYVYETSNALLKLDKIHAFSIGIQKLSGRNEEQIYTLKSILTPPISIRLIPHGEYN